MAVAEKMTTQQRLDEAQARMTALRAEASGLAEAMQQALAGGEKSRYLDLMVRENQLPRELAEAEGDARSLRRQGLQERYEALAAEEPGLRAKHEQTVRRNRERIAAIEAETSATWALYAANQQEWLAIGQELQAMTATETGVY